jgi:hypothetical protein
MADCLRHVDEVFSTAAATEIPSALAYAGGFS